MHIDQILSPASRVHWKYTLKISARSVEARPIFGHFSEKNWASRFPPPPPHAKVDHWSAILYEPYFWAENFHSGVFGGDKFDRHSGDSIGSAKIAFFGKHC